MIRTARSLAAGCGLETGFLPQRDPGYVSSPPRPERLRCPRRLRSSGYRELFPQGKAAQRHEVDVTPRQGCAITWGVKTWTQFYFPFASLNGSGLQPDFYTVATCGEVDRSVELNIHFPLLSTLMHRVISMPLWHNAKHRLLFYFTYFILVAERTD
jgi:hypothetical protein